MMQGKKASAVQSPRPPKVLSRLITERAVSVKPERKLETPDGGGESTGANSRRGFILSVRIRSILPPQIKMYE